MYNKIILVLALLVSSIGCSEQETNTTFDKNEQLIAINIFFNPDEFMMGKAKTANNAILTDYPHGFAFSSEYIPHITLLQLFVPTKDLDDVFKVVERTLSHIDISKFRLKALKYKYYPVGKLGLNTIDIDTSEKIVHFQENLIKAMAPYKVSGGTASAFFKTPKEPTITPETIKYVEEFELVATGENYTPHLTVGLASQSFLDDLLVNPYEQFSFTLTGLSICQLGNLGTCRKLLKRW